MSEITDEDILICEFIHDNKKDGEYVYGKEFYNFYGHKTENGIGKSKEI
jgi:hypothetical protein